MKDNEEGLLFKTDLAHEVKEEFCLIEGNHWYGEKNLVDLLDLDVHSGKFIDLTSDNEEEDDEGNKILIDFWGSSTMTIGDNRGLWKIFSDELR